MVPAFCEFFFGSTPKSRPETLALTLAQAPPCMRAQEGASAGEIPAEQKKGLAKTLDHTKKDFVTGGTYHSNQDLIGCVRIGIHIWVFGYIAGPDYYAICAPAVVTQFPPVFYTISHRLV